MNSPPNATAPTLFLRDIFLSWDEIVLFKNLDLTLPGGKCICLLGPSGVGKTSLLRLIAGLVPTEPEHETFRGKISVANNQPLSQQIAYMAQTDLLLPWLNALENTLIGAKLRGEMSEELHVRAKNLFAQIGLSAALKKFPHQLSGGMRQRVALIRTLLEEKPIVLMDEPFSAVDAITRYELQTLAANLLKKRTVLLITHDPLEALRLADEIYILSGAPATLKLVVSLPTPTPRDPGDPEVVTYQAELFHQLTQAKEMM